MKLPGNLLGQAPPLLCYVRAGKLLMQMDAGGYGADTAGVRGCSFRDCPIRKFALNEASQTEHADAMRQERRA